MNARKTFWFLLAAMALTLSVAGRAQAKAEHRHTRVDRLITQLLVARDDDDREEAAEDLGRIGGAKALRALDYAAANDEDRGVRRDARKAAERIRARLLARQIIREDAPTVVIQQPTVVHRPQVVVQQPRVVVRRPQVVVRPRIITLPHHRVRRVLRGGYSHQRGGRGNRSRGRHHSGFGLSFSLSF